MFKEELKGVRAVILLGRGERKEILRSIEKYLAGEFRVLSEELAEKQTAGESLMGTEYVDEETGMTPELFNENEEGKCFVMTGGIPIDRGMLELVRQRIAAAREDIDCAMLLLTQEEAGQVNTMMAIRLSEDVANNGARGNDEVPLEYTEPSDEERARGRWRIYFDSAYAKIERAIDEFAK